MAREPTPSSLPQAVVNLVLLVEDEPDCAAATRSVLELGKMECVVAKDGGQAQSMFVMRKPDCVLLDVMLPGESGFEVCERLKTTDPRVPVILVTAIDMDDARNLAKRVRADAYVAKPYNPAELIHTIHEAAQALWLRYRDNKPAESGVEPVRFACRCGKRFRVNPVHRGKTMTCPQCGETVFVPRHE